MHFRALCYKNRILWGRNRACAFFEVFLPIVFIVILVLLRQVEKEKQYPQQPYVDNTDYAFAYSTATDSVFGLNITKKTFDGCLINQATIAGFVLPSQSASLQQAIMEQVQPLNFTSIEFKTHEDYETYINSPDYWSENSNELKPICFVIEQTTDSDSGYHFSIHMNDYSLGFAASVPTTLQQNTQLKITPDTDAFNLYKDGGFLVLQAAISNWILSVQSLGKLEVAFAPMETLAYSSDSNFQIILQNVLASALLIIWIVPFIRFVLVMTQEKETRVKQTMRIMGMKERDYMGSFFVHYLIICFIISVLLTLVGAFTYFKHSDWLLLFFVYFCDSLAVFGLVNFFQSFFSTSRNGVPVAIILYYLTNYISLAVNDPSISSGAKYAASLLPTVAVNLVSKSLATFQGSGTGALFSNATVEFQNYSVAGFIGMMILDFVLFYLLGWYFENALPKQFGVKRHPCFPFMRSYWCPGRASRSKARGLSVFLEEQDDQSPTKRHSFFEKVPAALRQQISQHESLSVRGLNKIYPGGKQAVNDLSLDMFKGQIFALLGHNGAGKTTTISILTGLLEPSGGTAFFGDIDMFEDLDSLRKTMGLCPQHDVLFPDLTPLEHLRFYAMLKGVPDRDITGQVQRTLKKVNLFVKKDARAKTLSGGQKRKLSVAIALVGDSKLVMLDEPTSGMDLTARRELWNMLKEEKEGRVMVLTTHFMDEADILGDRIGIMANGTLLCCGSSLFLKNKFGVGYRLNISGNSQTPPLDSIIFGHIPSANRMSAISNQFIYQLPLEEAVHFAPLFEELDELIRQKKLREYGVAVTTLEEVFLTVGNENFEKINAQIKGKAQDTEESVTDFKNQEESDFFLGTDSNLESGIALGSQKRRPRGDTAWHPSRDQEEIITFKPKSKVEDDYTIADSQEQGELKIFCQQFSAQLKRFSLTLGRRTSFLLVELLVPVIFIVVGLALTLIQFFNNSPALLLVPEKNLPQPVYLNSNPDNTFFNSFSSEYVTPLLLENISTNGTLKALQQFDNSLFSLRQNLPQQVNGAYYVDFNSTVKRVAVFSNLKDPHSSAVYLSQIVQAIVKSSKDIRISFTNAPFPIISKVKAAQGGSTGLTFGFLLVIAFSIVASRMAREVAQERAGSLIHQQIVSGASKTALWLAHYVLDFARIMVVAVIAIALSYAFQVDVDYLWLPILLFPFACTPLVYVFGLIPWSPQSAQIGTSLISIILGAFLPIVAYVLRIIDSTVQGGIGVMWAFRWFPSFALADGIVNLAAYQIINKRIATSDSDYFAMDSMGGDLIFFPIGLVLYTLILILLQTDWNCSRNTKQTRNDYAFINEFPDGVDSDVSNERNRLHKITGSDLQSVTSTGQREIQIGSISSTSNNGALKQSVTGHHRAEAIKSLGAQMQELIDDAERDSSISEEVQVVDLEKRFGKFKAVRFLSFGVQFGEVFALLGVNGAGKSTTFKILTGEVKPTRGKVLIHNYDVLSQFAQLRKYIGYCPQVDPIIPNLTVREHLQFYSVLKRIVKQKRQELILKQVREMDLEEYIDVKADTLSGGNKRKLCVAVAMIGNPPIVLLDEPSTGIDPRARRFMWNVISRISKQRKKSAVVLTTHSMEEAEALSSRIGIMVRGQFKCLGSAQHLKNKFSNGYEIDLKVLEPTQPQLFFQQHPNLSPNKAVTKDNVNNLLQELQFEVKVKEGDPLYNQLNQKGKPLTLSELYVWGYVEDRGSRFLGKLKERFSNCELIQHFFSYFKFRVQWEEVKISIGSVFAFVEKKRDEFGISEYSVAQTTLEQIFNTFALQGSQ